MHHIPANIGFWGAGFRVHGVRGVSSAQQGQLSYLPGTSNPGARHYDAIDLESTPHTVQENEAAAGGGDAPPRLKSALAQAASTTKK